MTDKSVRYDRQLRLWGETGQFQLESSHVCLLSATAVGTETLKNLVLPGIGKFTIIDHKQVTQEDLGNNFFVTQIGAFRAKEATELLTEMNEFVPGTYLLEDPSLVIENNPDFFLTFSLIIVGSTLNTKSLLKLSKIAWDNNIPLFILKTCGLFASLRICVPEHTIFNSKEEVLTEDLRLSQLFDELRSYVDSLEFDLENSHTPFIALLPKFLEQWKKQNGGNIPRTSKEKDLFKAQIFNPKNSENFNQAKKNAYKVYTPYRIPTPVQEVLSDPKCKELQKNSSKFWVLASAVSLFVQNEGAGCLPLLGAIPDLHTTTEEFVRLQEIYANKAKKDFEVINNYVSTLVSNISSDLNISAEEVRDFCKQITQIGVLRYRSLADEYNPETVNKETLLSGLGEGNWRGTDHVQFYILFRAVEEFYSQHNRMPGSYDNEVEPDILLLKTFVHNLLRTQFGLDDTSLINDEYIHEFCRYGGSEVHTVAALLGGMAAQEVVKVLTQQWIPLNNTFIYDGIHSNGCSLIF